MRNVREIYRNNGKTQCFISYDEIDYETTLLLSEFNEDLLIEPQETPIEEFIEDFLGLPLEHHRLPKENGEATIGLIGFGAGKLPVLDCNDELSTLPIDEPTIIIDEELYSAMHRQNVIAKGKYRFNAAHEAGHWFLHSPFYMENDKNQLSLFADSEQNIFRCSTSKILSAKSRYDVKNLSDEEWQERQANYMAAALLMPKQAVLQIAEELKEDFGYLADVRLKVTSAGYVELLHKIKSVFSVNTTPAKIRLEKLNIIENNSNQINFFED